MPAIDYIQPDSLPPPLGHYAYATCANGFVFVSGLLPTLPDGTKMIGASFTEQTQQVFKNLETILHASGSDKTKLVQVRVYVTDIANWALFNQLYAQWLGAAKPARCVVPVPELHYGLAIEIEATALQ